MHDKITNVNVDELSLLANPETIKEAAPLTDKAADLVLNSRNDIASIIAGDDDRPLLIVGPCSIHDPKSAIEYAQKLAKLRHDLLDQCFIVMRVYFEKPRTTLGWKGLINDPDMDKSYNIEKGLQTAREILVSILELGLPTASEMLDTIVPQYIADLVCWASLGARTTESQPHREMASGLSMPVGFKNATNGDTSVAINAMKVAKHHHCFLGTNKEGQISYVKTKGNPNCHLILRGGATGPNFDPITIKACSKELTESDLSDRIMIDCSHGNSKKQQGNQPSVFNNVMHQIKSGTNRILGVMLESNLYAGNQSIPQNLSDLEYGISVTDECMDWDTTESLIRNAF
ncbi:3-deoxy-7-phosphoheptulonate synthase [Candidatus Marinamargulisbacteria bacterium SCGC AG-333-B06]|nr:3-deoxy-7-phosphoheptulonate synthase [Candidatus Marinamargulisbacteria bacterium SCGC AG-333-B06]